jgi:molybdopterin synthase sulfur carrier subunit
VTGAASQTGASGIGASQTGSIKVLYFAWLRERTGTGEETLALPAEVRNVGALVDWLTTRSAGYADAFARRNIIRCAVNQEFADPETPVRPGDEVAFFPPVTGG